LLTLDFPYLWLRPRYVASAKCERTRLIRIFGCAEDTPSRQKQTLLTLDFRIFGFAEDTSPRQNASEPGLSVSLAAPKIRRLGKMQINLLLPSAYPYLCKNEPSQ